MFKSRVITTTTLRHLDSCQSQN